MFKTQTTEAFEITLLARGKARFNHGPRQGQAARFSLFEVFNPATQGRYQVRVVEGQTVPQCSCPQFSYRLAGEGRTACKHGIACLRVLLQERAGQMLQAAGVSPAIREQLGGETAAEKDARVLAERNLWD